MWPFKKKKPKAAQEQQSYVTARCDGVVELIMYDYLVVAGEKHYCKAPLVELGRTVKKGQIVGK